MHQSWTAVRTGSSVAAVRQHRKHTLLLCWPPYGDDAASYQVLRAYPGEMFIYAGQEAAGSVRFHRELALNWTVVEQVALPHWPQVPDSLLIYRRNAVRRRHQLRDRCLECGRFIATGSIGRCDWCFERRPPALALRTGRHRVEYPPDVVARMPSALRRAFEQSPNRIA